MPPTTELLPNTVWEQAPYLGIMFIFMLFVFFWLLKSRSNDQEFQAQQQKEWQDFIKEQDTTWRNFSQEQRKENNHSMNEVNGSLRDLTTVSQELVNQIKEMRMDTSLVYQRIEKHDDQAREFFEVIKNPPKPRTKKPPITT